MHLITQYYHPATPERQSEIDYCLERNLNNPSVTTVHNLMEKSVQLPQKLKDHKKLITKRCKRRLTYSTCFNYIRQLNKSEIAVICNNDIFIDDQDNNPWANIRTDFFEKTPTNKILNLSRHEYDLSGKIWTEGQYSSYSSDAWVMQAPLLGLQDANFMVGGLFADWAIAGRFRDAGYHVYNWAGKYKIYHLDRVINRKSRHPRRKKHTESNSPESARSRLFICPYLNYDDMLKYNLNPQKAECTKRCKFEHMGKDMDTLIKEKRQEH